jgi:hypothetical protein
LIGWPRSHENVRPKSLLAKKLSGLMAAFSIGYTRRTPLMNSPCPDVSASTNLGRSSGGTVISASRISRMSPLAAAYP